MNTPSSPQQFLCPTCGAALPLPEGPSVRCDYCGSTVLVPQEVRSGGQPPRPASPPAANEPQFIIEPPVMIEIPLQAEAPARRGCMGCAGQAFVLLAFVLLVALIGGGFFLFSAQPAAPPMESPGNQALTEEARGPRPTSMFSDPPTPTASLPSTVELKFGSAGAGPGQFDDARYAVVDPNGNIFVADYQDGRLQKFDPSGKFVQLINVEPDRNGNVIIRDLVADYRGRLYVVRGGDILVYNAADGALAGAFPGQLSNLSYDKLAIDPANNMYALNTAGASRLEIVKLSPEGQVIWRDGAAVQEQLPQNRPSHVDWISVDGLGNIYLMDAYGGQVLKFSTSGKFIDRFGSKGKQAAELNSPGQMAVDPANRIVILDTFDGIVLKAFDPNGAYQGHYPWPIDLAYPRKLSFDLQGNLYTITLDSQVVRMKFDEPIR